MSLQGIINDILRYGDQHSQDILTGCAIAGLGLSVYLAGKAAVAISDILLDAKDDLDYLEEDGATEEDVEEAKNEVKKQVVKDIIKVSAGAAVMTFTTGICIIASNRVSASKYAGLAGIASISQTGLIDYRKKAREVLGQKKAGELDKAVYDGTFDERTAIRTGRGDDLVQEAITGQLLYTDLNYVRNRWNDICADLHDGEDVTLNDWLYDLGAEQSGEGARIIFRLDPENGKRMIHLDETAVLTKGGKSATLISYDQPVEFCA